MNVDDYYSDRTVPINGEAANVSPKDGGKGKPKVEPPDLSILKAGNIEFTGEREAYQSFNQEPATSFYEATFGSLSRGVQTSILGTSARVSSAKGEGFEGALNHLVDLNFNKELLNDPQVEELIMTPEVKAHHIDAMFRNASTIDDVKANLKVIQENDKLSQESARQGMAGTIFHSVGDAIGDPMSYAPVGTALNATKAAKVGIKLFDSNFGRSLIANTATSVASEMTLRNQITGEEANVVGAALGTVVLMGGMKAAGSAYKTILGPAENRIVAQQTAYQMGEADPTIVPNHDGSSRIVENPDGSSYEVTESGKIVTPHTVPPKARSSGRFFRKDLATTAANSDVPEVRILAEKMSQPTQGYKGDYARTEASAENINRAYTAESSQFMYNMEESLDELLTKHPTMSRSDLETRISIAAEGRIEMSQLSKQEAHLAKSLRERYDLHLARLKQVGLVPEGVPNYLPRVFNANAVSKLINEAGMDEAQRLIGDALYDSFAKATNKAGMIDTIRRQKGWADDMEITDDMIRQHAHDKAFGVVRHGENISEVVDSDGGLTRTADHLKGRMAFDTSGTATMADGTIFQMDSLRDYNLLNNYRSYSKSINGELALKQTTGKTSDELIKFAESLDDKGAKAIGEMAKSFVGSARSSNNSLADVISNIVRNSSLNISSGFMAPAQAFEVSSNVFRGVMPSVLDRAGVAIKEATGFKPDELYKMSDGELMRNFDPVLIAHEINTRNPVTFQQFKDNKARQLGYKSYNEMSMVERGAVSAEYGTMRVTEKNPFLKALNGVQEVGYSGVNNTVVESLALQARGGKASKYLTDKYLDSIQIDRSLADRALAYLKDYQVSKNGSMSNAAAIDPRRHDLATLTQAISEKHLMVSNKVGQGYDTPDGWFGKLFWQFKRFATVSTQYASQAGANLMKGDVDTMLYLIGGAVSALGYNLAYTASKMVGMEQSEREAYARDNLSAEALTVNSIKRMPLFAGYSMMYDFMGTVSPFNLPYTGTAKSTGDDTLITPRRSGDMVYNPYAHANRMGKNIMNMIPASRMLFNTGSLAVNGTNLLIDSVNEDWLYSTEEAQVKKHFTKSFTTMLPNVVGRNALMDEIWEAWGVPKEHYDLK